MRQKTLVLGASLNKERYSNRAVNSLKNNDHPVVAIGGKAGQIDGIEIYTEKIAFEEIDTVTLYLNPQLQHQYYDYIVDLHPRRVIFNPGTENPEFQQLLKQYKIKVELACTLVLLATNQY